MSYVSLKLGSDRRQNEFLRNSCAGSTTISSAGGGGSQKHHRRITSCIVWRDQIRIEWKIQWIHVQLEFQIQKRRRIRLVQHVSLKPSSLNNVSTYRSINIGHNALRVEHQNNIGPRRISGRNSKLSQSEKRRVNTYMMPSATNIPKANTLITNW